MISHYPPLAISGFAQEETSQLVARKGTMGISTARQQQQGDPLQQQQQQQHDPHLWRSMIHVPDPRGGAVATFTQIGGKRSHIGKLDGMLTRDSCQPTTVDDFLGKLKDDEELRWFSCALDRDHLPDFCRHENSLIAVPFSIWSGHPPTACRTV